jgi:hypothetical protein
VVNKKRTTGNKATTIEQAHNISIADKRYCTNEIIESFSFVKKPSGFIVPEKIINELIGKVIIDVANEEDSREIEEFMAVKNRQEEEAEQARRERRTEINREIAEQKRKKKEEK